MNPHPKSRNPRRRPVPHRGTAAAQAAQFAGRGPRVANHGSTITVRRSPISIFSFHFSLFRQRRANTTHSLINTYCN